MAEGRLTYSPAEVEVILTVARDIVYQKPDAKNLKRALSKHLRGKQGFDKKKLLEFLFRNYNITP